MPNLPDNWIGATLAVAILLLVAWAADRATYRLFLGVVRRMASRTRSTWDDRLIERKVFSRLAHAIPGAIVYYGVPPTLGLGPEELTAAATPIALTAALAQRVALAFIVVTAALAAIAFLDALNDIYNETYEQARSRPIKGYLQVVGLALYIAVGAVVVSILANRSPVVFLSGLGALTAVLLLVFRTPSSPSSRACRSRRTT
jgi:miniconductance mechanosensitive channel